MAYEIEGTYEWEPTLSLHQQIKLGQLLEDYLNEGGVKGQDLLKSTGLVTSSEHATWDAALSVGVPAIEAQVAIWADIEAGFLVPIPGAIAPIRYWLNVAMEPDLYFQLATDLGL